MSVYVKEREFMYLYTLINLQNSKHIGIMPELVVIQVRSSTDINGCCVWLLADHK
jgi:hypothetical protein